MPTLVDQCFTRTTAHLVLTYREGYTLRQHLVQHNVKTLDDVVEITKQLYSILKDMHTIKLAHFDIRKDNIVLMRGTSSWTVYLIDMGLSCTWKENGIVHNACVLKYDKSGRKIYMHADPQLFHEAGLKNANQFIQADIYSVGIIVRAMVNQVNHTDMDIKEKRIKRQLNDFIDDRVKKKTCPHRSSESNSQYV